MHVFLTPAWITYKRQGDIRASNSWHLLERRSATFEQPHATTSKVAFAKELGATLARELGTVFATELGGDFSMELSASDSCAQRTLW